MHGTPPPTGVVAPAHAHGASRARTLARRDTVTAFGACSAKALPRPMRSALIGSLALAWG